MNDIVVSAILDVRNADSLGNTISQKVDYFSLEFHISLLVFNLLFYECKFVAYISVVGVAHEELKFSCL